MVINTKLLYTILIFTVLLSLTSLSLAGYSTSRKKISNTLYTVYDTLDQNINVDGNLTIEENVDLLSESIVLSNVVVETNLVTQTLVLDSSFVLGDQILDLVDITTFIHTTQNVGLTVKPGTSLFVKSGKTDFSSLTSDDIKIIGTFPDFFKFSTNSAQFTVGLFSLPVGMYMVNFKLESEFTSDLPVDTKVSIQLVAYDDNLYYYDDATSSNIFSNIVHQPLVFLTKRLISCDMSTVVYFPVKTVGGNGLGVYRLGIQISIVPTSTTVELKLNSLTMNINRTT